MDCSLEHFKLLHCIQKIPLWIIVEYAWTHKMIDILEAVAADKELSLWPEVDLEFMTLEEPWRLRVASAQAYSIMRRRDVCQFEKVVALLEATHRLVPRLVSPIKHMKIMFGLKTMIVMWMLKNNKGIVDTVVKIIQYFPSKLPQYHDQCSCHDMYLMRKNHQDFKTLAQTLAMDKNKLQIYITEQMEEQYGECYAHKLEERLLRYLQELEAVLPRQTYIDELLKEERPRTEEERLLLEMITFDDTPLSTSLKRLLHGVLASSSPGRVSQKADQVAVTCVSSSKDAQHARPSEVILVPVERRALVEVKPPELRTMENVARHLSEDSPLLLEDEEDEDSVEEGRSQQRTTDKEGENVVEGQAMEMAKSKSSSGASDVDERAGTREEEDGEREMHVEGDDDKENDNSEMSDDSALENVPSPRFWCKHHRWVKSILHECSDVQPEQLQVQHDVTTSPTTLFKLSSSTSSSQDFTPSPLFSCRLIQSLPDSSTSSSQDLTPSLLLSCPLVQSHSASQTSTPLETTAQDSKKTASTDKGLVSSGLVGLAPTVLQTELSSRDSEVVTLSSLVHPLKYPTASNIDIPAFQPQINLQLSPPQVTTSRQQHAFSCLPEPVASTYSYIFSNKDGMSQNASSNSTGWPAPTRRPLSRLSRRFHRNHVTTSRQQHARSYPPELVAFPYSYTLSLSNKDSNMSQNSSTSTGCMSPPRRPLSRLSRRFQRNCSVVCRSQASTPFNHIPEQSGTHRQMTFPLFLTESNISVHSTLASAPNLQSRTLSDQVPLSSKPSSEQAIHSQPVAVPQTSNYVLSSPCVQWDLNTRHNTHQAQTLPCPSTISQSISQIQCQADRTQVRMSPQCQSMLLQSKLLQPLLRLTRLSQQECIGVTEGRSLTQEEVGNNEDEELEVGDGQQDLTDTSFNINSLYSSDESFDRDNEDSHDSDPDYIPQEKKQRVQLWEYEN